MKDKLQLEGHILGGRYRVLAVLGAGGVVYDGFDETLGKPVAIAVCTPETQDSTVLERLQAPLGEKAIVTAGHEHPDVVSARGWEWDESLRLSFLVMECLQGRDLAAALGKDQPARAGASTADAALPVLSQDRGAPVLLMPPPLEAARPPAPPPKRRGSRKGLAAAAGGLAILGAVGLASLRTGPEQPVGVAPQLGPESAVKAPSPATPHTARRLVSPSQVPRVDRSADGEYRLALPGTLWTAVDAFLAPRPNLRLAGWADAGPDARMAMEDGRMQYPFAVWRDLDNDGDQDVALVFISTGTVNDWDWRDWSIVVFRAWPNGHYDDLMVTTMNGACFDGMLYVPELRHVEYGCFEVAVGAFSWNGRGFSVQTPMGD